MKPHNFQIKTRAAAALAALLLCACIAETSETIEVADRLPANGIDETTRPAAPRNPAGNKDSGTDPSTGNGPDNLTNNPAAPSELPRSEGQLNKRLAAWFSVRENYDLVYKDVLKFYPEGRYNGCVAFLSAALRRLDVYIPINTATESPSLITKPFSRFLENSLGWQRIGTSGNLRSGDIVFTQDNPSYPTYPAHTYMFLNWSNKAAGLANVIDNQEFTHERNIYSASEGFNFTPYAYALRAP
jgi:hypothetical protein